MKRINIKVDPTNTSAVSAAKVGLSKRAFLEKSFIGGFMVGAPKFDDKTLTLTLTYDSIEEMARFVDCFMELRNEPLGATEIAISQKIKELLND